MTPTAPTSNTTPEILKKIETWFEEFGKSTISFRDALKKFGELGCATPSGPDLFDTMHAAGYSYVGGPDHFFRDKEDSIV